MATEQDHHDDAQLARLGEHLLDLIPRLAQIISTEAQAGGADSSITLTQLRVLALLQCRCRLPSELARELRVTPATASETVDLLVRRGFITRGDEPLDRRQTPLSITEAGRRRLEAARGRALFRLVRMVSGLSPAEREALQSALAALSAASAQGHCGEGSANA